MALDANIILQGRAPQLDNPLDVQNKVLTMRHMAQQAQMQDQQMADNQGIKSAFNRNVVTDENGGTSLNKQGVLSDLRKGGLGRQAVDYQKMFADQDLDVMKKNTQTSKEIAWGVSDPATYQQARQKMLALGLPNADKMPEQFDPQFVQNWQVHTLEGEKQLEHANKEREFNLRKQEIGTKHEENAIKRDQVNSEKVDKLAKDFKKDMDPDSTRTGNFGKISAKVQQAEYLDGLVGSFNNRNLPPAQMEELALGMANMISGANGGAARSQVEALVPHSAMGDAQKLKSWFMNEPLGANQQAFVEMMSHTIEREKSIANDQLNGIRIKRLSTHEKFQKSAPDQFNRMIGDYGIDPANVKNGKYTPPAAAGTVQMRDPKGNIRAVPADQVDAAKAAGGAPL